jgi:hypothetical protein
MKMGSVSENEQPTNANSERYVLPDVRGYVIESAAKGEGKAATQLAETAGETCQATGQYDLAAKTYATLGEVLEKSQDASVAMSGRKMRVQGERLLALSKGVPKVPNAPVIMPGSKLVPLDLQMLGNYSVVGSIGSGQVSEP